MSNVNFELVGITSFMEKAVVLDSEIEKALEIAGTAGAVPIVSRWKEKVQTTAYSTGNYMRSIHSWTDSATKDEVQIVVGTDIVDPPYPFYLEYGTRFMDARPTMTPAFEETRDEAISEIGKVLKLVLARHGAV